MTPIGRGQRELIIGDRKTGKTAIAIDTIINQKGTGVQLLLRRHRPEGVDGRRHRRAPARRRRDGLHDRRSSPAPPTPPRCSTSPPTPAPRWPSTSCTAKGGATLCVYDDLSKQAAAYRQLSLLLRRPPGREAYPGDVFYFHSRLLERGVKLREEYAMVPKDTPADSLDRAIPSTPRRPHRPREGRRTTPSLYHRPHGRKKAEPSSPPADRDNTRSTATRHRRLADRAADHRDAGRRGLGLHPDERDLDHRRPDLPRARPVLRRRPAGHERRHQRLARRRQRPDQGDEEGRRLAAARPRRLPRTRSVRPARHRARHGHPAPARPRLPHGRAAQAAAVPALPVVEQIISIYAGTQGYLDDVPVNEVLRVRGRPCSSMRATRTPR